MLFFPRRRRPSTIRRSNATRLHLEVLEDRTVPSVVPGTGIQGNLSFQNIHDADTGVAVGLKDTLEVSNGTLQINDKATGAVLSQQSLANFFSPIQPNADPIHFFDVNTAYDNQTGRYIVESMYGAASPFTSVLLVAVSDSSDPSAGFSQMHAFNLVEPNQVHGDNALFGYNADAYTFTVNEITQNQTIVASRLITVPKSSVLTPGAPFVSYQMDLAPPNAYLTPVKMNDVASGTPQWFVELPSQGPGSAIKLVKETNQLSSTPTFTNYTVTVPSYGSTPRAPQPGTTKTIDTGYFGYFWPTLRGNRLVTTQDVGTGGVTQVRWYDINIGGTTPSLTQSGLLNPGPGVFTYDGSVNIAPNGDLGFVYMQSSASQYMSLYATAQEPGAAAGTTDTPMLIQAGTVPYLSNRNGDNTQVSIDPVTGGFWGAGQYAYPNSPSILNNWATYIGNWGTSSATHLAISAPTTTAAGTTSVTVSALNGVNGVATGYTGTVHFTSTDLAAGLPADYTFTQADAGQHTFTVTLATAGTTTLTAATTGVPSVTGSQTVAVTPGSATQLLVSELNPTPVAGTPLTLTLRAMDAFNNIATGYTGTVQFSSTDPAAALPGNYTFTAADGGRHTFTGLMFETPGAQSLQVTDAANSIGSGPQSVTVSQGAAPGNVPDTLATALATGLGPSSGSFTATTTLGDAAEGAADVNMFSFQGNLGSTLTAIASTPPGGTPMSTYLRLFSASGTELANSGAGSSLSYTFSATATYYLGVSGQPNTNYDPTTAASGVAGSTGTYELDVNLAVPKNIGDTLTTALPTGLGPTSSSFSTTTTLGDVADGAADVNLFSFQAALGSTLSATTTTPAGSTPVSTYLRLFDASGNELANSGAGSSLSYTFTTGGTYYVGVSGSGNSAYSALVAGSGVAAGTGDYQLSLGLSTPQLSIGNVRVTRPATGSTNANFTVSLSAASAQMVTVNYSVLAGTARPFIDYTPVSGTLTFAPGQLTQTISVPVLGGTTRIGTETYFVNLTSPTSATLSQAQAIGTILDTTALPTVTINSASTTEGTSGTKTLAFTVKLSAASAQVVTVRYATADRTAIAGTDYKAASGMLVFYPGDTTETINVTVYGYPGKNSDQTFALNLSSPTNAVVLTGTGVGTILNANNTVSIAAASATAPTSGTGSLNFTVSLATPVPANGQPVVVQYTTANGTGSNGAMAGRDYVNQTGSVTFAPGTSTQTITVTVLPQPLNQPTRTLTVSLTSSTNAQLSASKTAVGTIFDSVPVPGVSVNNSTGWENSSANKTMTFTVSLSAASGQTVTVPYATGDGTAVAGTDYIGTSGTLTFAPGTTSKTVSVTVLAGSNVGPSKAFSLNLGSPINATVSQGSGTGTIVEAGPLSTLNINSVSTTEGTSGTKMLTFTVTLSPTVPTGGTPVTVQYSTADGTAIAGTDYGAVSGTLTFKPGVATQTIGVPVYGYPGKNSDQTFTVNLMSPSSNGVILTGTGVGTILNANNSVSISAASAVVSLNTVTPMNFTVSLAAPVPANGQPVVVQYTTVNGSGANAALAGRDYVSQTGSVTFAPGTSTQTITVLVLPQALDQLTRTFTVSLTSATNAQLSANKTAVGTINNNNPLPFVDVSDAVVAEPTSGTTTITFTVTLSSASGLPVTVQYATGDGSAVAGTDYLAASGTLTFAPGVTSQTVTITVLGDLLVDPNEVFFLNLLAPSNATLRRSTGQGTILNDFAP
jgi:hypothetical protein